MMPTRPLVQWEICVGPCNSHSFDFKGGNRRSANVKNYVWIYCHSIAISPRITKTRGRFILVSKMGQNSYSHI